MNLKFKNMKRFNIDDYQGKTQKQVEDSYKFAFYGIVGVVIIMTILILIPLFNG